MKLEFAVQHGLAGIVTKEITMPVEILAQLEPTQKPNQSQVMEYPKAQLAPAEFRPRLLPGAHYKISQSQDQEAKLSHKKLPEIQEIIQNDS